jgi:hypothetical protein
MSNGIYDPRSPEEQDIDELVKIKRELGWSEMQCLEYQIKLFNDYAYEISRWHKRRQDEDYSEKERGY